MKSFTAVIVLVVNLMVCSFVGLPCRGDSILFDGFDGPALDPEWTIGPGFGGVSLTASPGNLRYSVPLGQGDGLYRPFSGTQWTLDSKIAYEMPFSNGRQVTLQVVFGDLSQKGVNSATWQRDADQACGTCSRNRVIGSFRDGGDGGTGPVAPPFLGGDPEFTFAFPPNAADTYYVRIIRDGQQVTIQESGDGSAYNDVVQRMFNTSLGSLQTILLSGAVSGGSPGRGDYDYISVTSNSSPLVGGVDFSLTDVVAGGTLIAGNPADTANGQFTNTPHGTPGGGVSYSFASPFEFRYEFEQPADLAGNFYLYNGWDVQGQAINDFELRFLDSSGIQIGLPFDGAGSFGVVDDVFTLAQSYSGVKTAVLRVNSVHDGFLEFREVAFEGVLVPEPIPTQYTWTGAGGNTDFQNPDNWTPSGFPISVDTATINGPATISGEGQPGGLTLNGVVLTPGLVLEDAMIVNRAILIATSGSVLRFIDTSIDNRGHIQTQFGTVEFDEDTSVIGGTLSAAGADAAFEVNGATIDADLIEANTGASINLNRGLLRTAMVNTGAGGRLGQDGGRLETSNFVGRFEQDGGVYAPGLPVGVSTLTGNYRLGSQATLEIELAGAELGNFDQLLVGGNVSLDGGELSVLSVGGFLASAGDSFGIIRVDGSLNGVFDGLTEGALVGDFGEDLFITYTAGDGNDIGLYNPLVLGSVPFTGADPDDHAFFVGERAGSGIPAPDVTITLAGLDLLNGSSFTLDPNEILDLGDGTLFIGQGAVFSGNGIILGNVINAGLLRIPIVRIPTIAQTTGGYIEIELPEPTLGAIFIDIDDGGGGFAVGGGTLLSFEFETEPAPIVIQGTPAPNDGTIRFDASLEITGSYEQRETGALRLFIAGNDLPGENYSQLIVGQEVTLAGAIELVFDPTLFGVFGYTPMVGDTFDLIIADDGITIADTGLNLANFITEDGANLVSGVTLSAYNSGIAADPDRLLKIGETLFRLDLVENDTILRATLIAPIAFVPEPGALTLLAFGGIAPLVWRSERSSRRK